MISLALLIGIASLMVAVIVFILYYIENIKSMIGLYFSYFGLVMMLSMFIGAIIYLYNPSNITLAIAFAENMVIMISFLAYFFIIAEELVKQPIRNLRYHIYVLSTLAVLNEILMGSTFVLAQFGKSLFSSVYSSFYSSVNSYWFFYPMMVEMLSLYLIQYIRGVNLKSLLPLIGVTSFPPTAFNIREWFLFGVVMTMAVSALGIVSSGRNLWRYIYSIILLATLGTFINPIPYDICVIIAMILYYSTIFSSTMMKTK